MSSSFFDYSTYTTVFVRIVFGCCRLLNSETTCDFTPRLLGKFTVSECREEKTSEVKD